MEKKKNEISKSEPKSVAAKEKKSKKEPKLFPAKKLPGLFKKSYTEKQFEKKILRKIHVPQDKKLVQDMFSKGSDLKRPDRYAVPAASTFTKNELKHLKELSKDIASHKARIKLIPLAAAAAFVAAVVLVVGAFKNPLAKKAIKGVCEGVFGARTDVRSVDLRIMDASLTVRGLAVGNKSSVMKNLFEVETIAVDFNLVQALRGKFDAENLEVTGIAVGTDRTTSCALPPRQEKKKEKKEKKQSESAFMKNLKATAQGELDSMKGLVTDLLGGDDVDSIVASVQEQLRTPAAVTGATEEVNAMIGKWQAKPAEIASQVNDFAASVQALQSINLGGIKDVASLKDTLTKVNNAITTGNALKESTVKVSDEIKADSRKVTEISGSVMSAVNADKEFAEQKLGAAKDLVMNAGKILTGAIDSIGYSIMGKYYPYVQMGIDKALELKASAKANSSTETKEKKEKKDKKSDKNSKKNNSRRMQGTTFWYTRENPAFLIERIAASGPGFSAEGRDISSNQDLRGKPMSLSGTYVYRTEGGDINHAASLVVDARSYSTDALISVDYTGKGFTASIDGTSIAKSSGVPSVDGRADVTLKGAFGEGLFNAYGNVSLNPVSLTSDGFENELITKYYNQALGTVKKLSFGYDASYSDAKGVRLSLNGNYADVFANALSTVVTSIGSDAKDAALKKIQEELNSSSNAFAVKTKEFFGIEGDIDIQSTKVSDLQKILESKAREIQAQIEAQTKAAATEAVKSVVGDNEAASKAVDAAGSLLKGLLKK